MTDDTGYLGNPLIKRSGVKEEWSHERQLEYVRCMDDPIYFAEKYIKIVHVDHGLIPIKLYDFQKEIINKITNNRMVTVNTSRQAGKTTTAMVVILHYILFNKHKTVGLLANKGDAAREILDRIKLAFEALPKWLQQGVKEYQKGSIELENGCKVIAAATSSSSVRGKSIAFLYIDETAFVENWDEFFASVFPTITSGKETKMLFTSTPKGLNHFYKTCEGAKKYKTEDHKDWNGYHYIEVKWDAVPGRDEEWKKTTLGGMDNDLEKFGQEFCCQFLGSSGTLISGQKLKELVFRTPLHENMGIKQYYKPERDREYVCIADVSRGKGLDYSAFSIIDVTEMPYQQVCTFRDNTVLAPDYATILYRMGMLYNEASMLVELNDIGAQVADILWMDYGYENIVMTENAGRAGKRVSGGFGGQVDRGVVTTKSVKGVGCSTLKMLIEQEQLIINDFDTIEELSRFAKKGNSYEAEPGAHDDTVMPLVLFSWLSTQGYFRELTDIDTMNNLKEFSEDRMMEDLLPFGFIDNGVDNDDGWVNWGE